MKEAKAETHQSVGDRMQQNSESRWDNAPSRRRNPRKYAVTKKMKQKDRIADDYYELLRNVA